MKSLVSFFISCLPFNYLRIFLYKVFYDYDIDSKSKVGMFNIINCNILKMENARIGFLNQIMVNDLTLNNKSVIKKRNRLKDLNELVLNENSEIRSDNFIGAPAKGTVNGVIDFSNQNIYIGQNSSILRGNYFDIVDEVFIGENVVFGGNGSEIWTHGFSVYREMLVGKIKFGNNIFVGSGCIFTKGINIVSETTLAPGSVIYKSIEERGTYSSHHIRKVK